MPKIGIDYFPLACALDEKFELIEAEFGLTGFAVVVKLLQRIYGEHGYYCEWKKEVALLFAKKIGLGGNVVSEIVSAAIKWGIFDKTLYDKYGILTSVGIQKRYFEAVSRRKSVELISGYLLFDHTQILKNVDISLKNVDISRENVSIPKQSRGEESKGEDSSLHTLHSISLCDGGDAANGPPTIDECEDYFWSLCSAHPDFQGVGILQWPFDPYSEADRFYQYNENRGWDRAYEWHHMAKRWCARILTGGIQ